MELHEYISKSVNFSVYQKNKSGLARKLGVPPGKIYGWMKGSYMPLPEFNKKLIELINMNEKTYNQLYEEKQKLKHENMSKRMRRINHVKATEIKNGENNMPKQHPLVVVSNKDMSVDQLVEKYKMLGEQIHRIQEEMKEVSKIILDKADEFNAVVNKILTSTPDKKEINNPYKEGYGVASTVRG